MKFKAASINHLSDVFVAVAVIVTEALYFVTRANHLKEDPVSRFNRICDHFLCHRSLTLT